MLNWWKHQKKQNNMQKYKSYAEKKEAQKSGAYDGSSPFFKNIPEFQFLKPLHKNMYPHLRAYGYSFKLPNAPWQKKVEKEEVYDDID